MFFQVRVPLSDGPLDNMLHVDEKGCSFEAVALDCSLHTPKLCKVITGESLLEKEIDISFKKKDCRTDPLVTPNGGDKAKTEDNEQYNPLHNEDKKYVLLILAGLTGGSGEGYVVDLVNEANQQGALPCNAI